MYRNITRFVAISTLALAGLALGSTAAHAGIFHRKSKPLKTSDDALASVKSQQPDKELFDRAMLALKHGKYDIARLDLQILLNTYPDSEYQMRAKLAVGDTWFRQGGAAAMEQAESEYKDFITFFPNQPEAAEAQMKVADIYYKQMGKPDRDPAKTERAQEEYRQMILQFPDSTLIPQAKQRLREVQEVMAAHEFDIGNYYLSQDDYPAAIARLQSLVDDYPQFSQVDQALIGVGNAYSSEAHFLQTTRLDPASKERVVALYDQRAAQAYDRVILEYPMMPHADDARDHLEALNQPVPSPSKQQIAASEAMEQSRSLISLKDRAVMLITARPATVQATRVGEPTLTDPKPILASQVSKATTEDVNWAIHPNGKPAPTFDLGSNVVAANATALTAGASVAGATSADASNSASGGSTPDGSSLQLQDVTSGSAANSSAADTSATQTVSAPSSEGTPAPAGPAGNSIHASGAAGTNESTPASSPASSPASWPSATPEPNGGLPTVAPKDNTPLPATQAPTEAPDQVNDVTHTGHAVNTADQSTPTGKKKKKNPKPKFNSKDQSSSKHKKKKGLDKLNPF